MSRGYDFDERGGDRNQDQLAQPGFQHTANGRTAGDANNPQRTRHDRDSDRGRSWADERLSMPAIEKWHGLSDRERGTLREIGRFRTIDAEALLKYRYDDKPAAFQKEIARLQRQGLLLRRSISVGKNRDTLGFVSTSRGRRAQWEGPELTANVLSL